MPINAVVFDIGNVLIEWQPERYYDRVYGVEKRKALFDQVDLHGMNDRVDRGEHFRDVIYDTAEQYPEFRAEIRDWHDKWIELAQPAIDRSVRCLRALRAKAVPVFSLTNFGVESFAYAQTQYDFLTEFDQGYVSGHIQIIKPDAGIYAALEHGCGLPPETLLFTDDRLENINAAAQRGWHTHHFTGPDGWAKRLVAEGLLTKGEAA